MEKHKYCLPEHSKPNLHKAKFLFIIKITVTVVVFQDLKKIGSLGRKKKPMKSKDT